MLSSHLAVGRAILPDPAPGWSGRNARSTSRVLAPPSRQVGQAFLPVQTCGIRYTSHMDSHLTRRLAATALCVCLCHTAAAGTNGALLVVSPLAWQPALADFVAFKQALGFDVSTATTESIATPPQPADLRQALADYHATVSKGSVIVADQPTSP